MAIKEYFEFTLPTRVMFGAGLANEVGSEIEGLGCSRALLITDRGVEKAGLVDRVKESIEESSVGLAGIYSDVPQNSELGVVKEIASEYEGVDLLVSLGGGSVIDTAKGVAILMKVGGDLLDWQGALIIPEFQFTHVAIPTTAGTGAEVSLAAIIRDEEAGLKISFNSEYILPTIAMLDPELTLTLPPTLTATTGIDALTHATEAFTSIENNPPSNAYAYQAVSYITRYLPIAYRNGEDLEARSHLLVAACFGALCIDWTLSLGACHALAHSVGGNYGVPHGLANTILLPHIMEFNLDHATDRFAALAPAAGINTSGMSEKEAGQAFIDRVKELIGEFDIPRTLSEAGAGEDKMEKMVEDAMGDAQMLGNPHEAESEDVEALYRAAM